jgi:hypothetical protein
VTEGPANGYRDPPLIAAHVSVLGRRGTKRLTRNYRGGFPWIHVGYTF